MSKLLDPSLADLIVRQRLNIFLNRASGVGNLGDSSSLNHCEVRKLSGNDS